MKIWVAILFTILLNYLCSLGLGTISLLIVFIPFILMTLVVAILLLMFGLDPSTGKLKIEDKSKKKKRRKRRRGRGRGKEDDGDIGPGDPDIIGDATDVEGTTLDYYNSGDVGKGKGSSKTEDAKTETKQEKTDRLLTRSILFYSEDLPNDKDGMLGKKKGDDDLKGATNVENDNSSFDSNNVKLYIEDKTNLIYGMGEHEIASWYKMTALECINNLEGTTKEKQEKVFRCLEKLIEEVRTKIPTLEKQNIFTTNFLHRYCPDARGPDVCNEVLKKNWLKFE
jgi:hypothetical protein